MQLSTAPGQTTTTASPKDRVAAATLIGDLIRDLAVMRRNLERQLVCDASIASLSVLSALERGGPLHVSEIAAALGVDLSVASRHASTLERQGLLVRRPSADDRRAHVVTLTESGAQTLAQPREWLAQRLEASLESWSLERLHDLADALTELRSDLSTFLPTPHTTTGDTTR